MRRGCRQRIYSTVPLSQKACRYARAFVLPCIAPEHISDDEDCRECVIISGHSPLLSSWRWFLRADGWRTLSVLQDLITQPTSGKDLLQPDTTQCDTGSSAGSGKKRQLPRTFEDISVMPTGKIENTSEVGGSVVALPVPLEQH